MVNISIKGLSWDEINKTSARMARGWMRSHVGEFVDPFTDEVNSTAMAEEAALQIGRQDWLDDSQSIIWDIAIQVADEYIQTDERFWRW